MKGSATFRRRAPGETLSNEAVPIQPKDTGTTYRIVDCKYIYNLDVTSLSGAGTYHVWVNIDGANVPYPARFDLRYVVHGEAGADQIGPASSIHDASPSTIRRAAPGIA